MDAATMASHSQQSDEASVNSATTPPAPDRGVRRTNSLDRHERSPRSTIVYQAEDGIILTKTTRNRRMTRRHSLSRTMGEAPSGKASRRNSGDGSMCSPGRAPRRNSGNDSMFSLEKPSRRNSGNGSTCSQTSLTQAEATHIPLGRRGVDALRLLFTGMGNSQNSGNLSFRANARAARTNRRASTGATSSTPVLTQSQQVQPKKRSRRASMSSTPALSQQGDPSPTRPPMNVSRRGSLGRMNSSPALHQQGESFRRPRMSRQASVTKNISLRGLPRDTSFGKTDSLRDWGSSTHSSARRGKSDSICGSNHRSRMQRESSLADLMVDCNTTISVSNTWASVRGLPDYQKLFGEQCILRFLEANPQARKQMRLESLFTPRFTTLCKVIFEVVDFVTTLLGPELEEASKELSELGQRCRDEGINTLQLGDAVSSAVAVLLGDDVTPDMTKAWKVTFDSLANRMSVVSNNC